MGMRWWLQLVTLVTSCYNVGTIWMAHLGWRLFAAVGRAEFPAYHRAWWYGWRGIQPVVFPCGILTTLGALAQLSARGRAPRAPAWAAWLGVALQAVTWGATAAWWGPGQAQLEQVRLDDNTLNPLYRRLLATHWLRVALITAFAAVQLGMTSAGLRIAMTDRQPASDAAAGAR